VNVKKDVVVVGAGPVGAYLGNRIAALNIDFSLLDKAGYGANLDDQRTGLLERRVVDLSRSSGR
jgi:2-polyprenyl-6-methoxyphenol hydroxylase-like FAD-dependent oxidoreductase